MKRVFGIFEAVFDVLYICAALVLGLALLFSGNPSDARILAGVMALVLVIGDAFHLFPRVMLIVTRKEARLRAALGRGKQLSSITMTIFYLFLWHIALTLFFVNDSVFWTFVVYLLAIVRIFICLLPHNKWEARYTPLKWAIWRNVLFFLLGAAVTGHFFFYKKMAQGLEFMWLAVALSFAFYLPVVLCSNKNPKIGMLMLPKTCTYLWMLAMCLSL